MNIFGDTASHKLEFQLKSGSGIPPSIHTPNNTTALLSREATFYIVSCCICSILPYFPPHPISQYPSNIPISLCHFITQIFHILFGLFTHKMSSYIKVIKIMPGTY